MHLANYTRQWEAQYLLVGLESGIYSVFIYITALTQQIKSTEQVKGAWNCYGKNVQIKSKQKELAILNKNRGLQNFISPNIQPCERTWSG